MSEKGRRTNQPNFIDTFKKYLQPYSSDTEERYYKIFGVIVRELIHQLSEEDIERLCRKSGYLYGDQELTVIRHLKKCEEETRVGELDFKDPENAIAWKGAIISSPQTTGNETGFGAEEST